MGRSWVCFWTCGVLGPVRSLRRDAREQLVYSWLVSLPEERDMGLRGDIHGRKRIHESVMLIVM